jgi:phenylalanine-4-hydroxylase
MTHQMPIALPEGLRGDYASARDDFSVPQRHHAYTAADHATWRALYARQSALLPKHAARAFRDSLARLDVMHGVPDFEDASKLLRARTGWSLIGVPGLIPDDAFFGHLAARRFPVTVWIRKPEELDYVVEPDIFHDFFGHVPLLVEPAFADFLQAYGRLGEHAAKIGALKPLARLYWHMVEFGLIREDGAPRAYGAGILSSSAETIHSTTSAEPRRLRFDAARVLRSDYEIDKLQPTYFVIDDYSELFASMEHLPGMLAAARDAAPIPPGAADPSDIPA